MSDLLGGMTISPDTRTADSTRTILYGRLADQAALAGVLSTLYELHLMVLLVKRLDEALPAEPVQEQAERDTET
jgi:ACR3 family arsenite efflux pump ArsB